MIEIAQKTEAGKICYGKQWGSHVLWSEIKRIRV